MSRIHYRCKQFIRSNYANGTGPFGLTYTQDRNPARVFSISETYVQDSVPGHVIDTVAGVFLSPSDSHANTTIKALYSGTFFFDRLDRSFGATDLIVASWYTLVSGSIAAYWQPARTFQRGCPTDNSGVMVARGASTVPGMTIASASRNATSWEFPSQNGTHDFTHEPIGYFGDGATGDVCFGHNPAAI